ncbi:MAG TPA: FtsW/RodA/SpoVE family cell cycle protein [Acidimicrobiales bacterium]|nr:FtsW/RodA/SpoVE family cell cycle protein [Acidimicrobiales bacterium]
MAIHLLERGARVRSRRDENPLLTALRHVDYVLLAATLAISAFGVIMVYSATRNVFVYEPTYYLKRQVVYLVLGVGLMLMCMVVDYRRLEQWGYILYGLVVCSLLAVFAIGKQVAAGSGAASTGDTQRWIQFGPIHIQPSEFGVLAVIVAVGLYASRHETELGPRRLIVMAAMVLLPMALVYKQPDLGTTIVIAVVVAALLVFAGVRLRYLVGAAAVVALGVTLIFQFNLLSGYQMARIHSFFNQSQAASSANYNLTLAKEAIGSGGLKGLGLFHGPLTTLQYVPVAYADFIFSAIGEQTGFIGATVVLGLFALIVFRIFRAMQVARDTLGRLICGGVLAFVVFSVFQNVGMNVGLMPITGIPLPFISYGGSALLAFFAAIGLVANVEMRRFRMR